MPKVSAVSVNIRVKASAADLVDRASGVNGWLARVLPEDPKTAPPPPGSVEWLKPEEGESGPDFLRRARRTAEQETECKGLAFSNSESIGLRKVAGSCASAFVAEGFPSNTTFDGCKRWVLDNGWQQASVLRRFVKSHGRDKVAQFRFKGRRADGTNDVWCIEADLPGGSSLFIDIAPWRPTKKRTETVPILQRGLGADPTPPQPANGSKSAVVATTDVQRGPRSAAPNDTAASGAPAANGERGRSRSPRGDSSAALNNLGLTVKSLPKDGACLYHSIAALFADKKKEPKTGGAVRRLTVDHMRTLRNLESCWDRQDSHGRPCAAWGKYLEEAEKPATWGGELEALAAAHKWGLRIVVVRPGLESVLIGNGGVCIWVLYKNSHYEPLFANNDPNAAAARKDHVNHISDAWRLRLTSGSERTWTLKGGGAESVSRRSVRSAASPSVCSLRTNASVRSAASPSVRSLRTNASMCSAASPSVRSLRTNADNQTDNRSAVQSMRSSFQSLRTAVIAPPAAASSNAAGALPKFFGDDAYVRSADGHHLRQNKRKGSVRGQGAERLTPEAQHALTELHDAAAAYRVRHIPPRERAVLLAAATRKYQWLCSPTTTKNGDYKCRRCKRVSDRLPRLYSTSCRSYAGPPVPARERQAALLKEGLTYIATEPLTPPADLTKSIQRQTQFANWPCPLCDFVVPNDDKRPWNTRRFHLQHHGARGQRMLDKTRGKPKGSKFTAEHYDNLKQARASNADKWVELWNASRPTFAHQLVRAPCKHISPSNLAKGCAANDALGSSIYGCALCKAGCVDNPNAKLTSAPRWHFTSSPCTSPSAVAAAKGIKRKSIDRSLANLTADIKSELMDITVSNRRIRIRRTIQ